MYTYLLSNTGVRLSSLESSKATCRQGTLKEVFKQHFTDVSTAETLHWSMETVDVPASVCDDMATCPVCNQAVPAENAAFNQHIDECLNCSVVQETRSDTFMAMHNRKEDSHSILSPNQSPFKMQESQGFSSPKQKSVCTSSSSHTCTSIHSRKRKAPSVPAAHKCKQTLTLDHYFNKQKM